MADPEQNNPANPLSKTTLHCNLCEKDTTFSAAVSVLVVFAPALAEPYPLIPAGDYRVCMHVEKGILCPAVFTLIDRAVAAHPQTRFAGPWSRAIVVFKNGDGADVKAKRIGVQVAQA